MADHKEWEREEAGDVERANPSVPVDQNKRSDKRSSEKIITLFIALTLVIAVGALAYTAKSLFLPGSADPAAGAAAITGEAIAGTKMKSLSLTGYDRTLAKQFMDQDNDGTCDSCGMPVEMCMDSGQLQCNMDSKSTIGVLDSAHIHADWKIYVNGKAVDLSDKAHMERMRAGLPVSSFIHVDSGSPAPEKTGDLLHMHATGVPLWIFFESVGMKLDKNCLLFEDGEKYCNDGKNSLKFYVNGKSNEQYGQYVFNDLDKILISYGAAGEDLKAQLASLTDFAGRH